MVHAQGGSLSVPGVDGLLMRDRICRKTYRDSARPAHKRAKPYLTLTTLTLNRGLPLGSPPAAS